MLGITFCIVAVHRDDGDQRVIQYVKGNISTYDVKQQDSQEAEEKKTIRFLVDNLGDALLGLLFEGNPFGCSTLKTDGENGEILFGRNFDWSACDALIVQSSPENGYASISMVNRDFINQSGILWGDCLTTYRHLSVCMHLWTATTMVIRLFSHN